MTSVKSLLEFFRISKIFPGVIALQDVSFGVREASVHALIGENGAGKSTLLKILSGAYVPSSGTVKIASNCVSFHSTADAIQNGIAVIYQELNLAAEMSVAENIFLGHLPCRFGLVNRKKLYSSSRALLQMLGEDIDPSVKVGTLSIGQRQMVEIAKALSRNAKIIAFDEPTSSLSEKEIRKLFSVIRDLKNKGHVILYVSHRMEEIFHICDSVTVLRDGKHIKTFDSINGLTPEELVKLMVGREIVDIYGYTPRVSCGTGLEVENLISPKLAEPISLSVAKGEIVGLFGLVGAGRSELLKSIFGSEKKEKAIIRIDGQLVDIRSPSDSIRHGMMLCPEDRKKEGIFLIRPVWENINISARRNNVRMGLFINKKWEDKNAFEQINRLSIKTPSIFQIAMNLSGGNQQKTILGRWLSEKIRVLLLDEPTRGIDVGAKSEIYSIIYQLAKSGVAILMASSELPEILGVSDRILVLRNGAISGSFTRQQASAEKVLAAALPLGSS